MKDQGPALALNMKKLSAPVRKVEQVVGKMPLGEVSERARTSDAEEEEEEELTAPVRMQAHHQEAHVPHTPGRSPPSPSPPRPDQAVQSFVHPILVKPGKPCFRRHSREASHRRQRSLRSQAPQ